MMKKGPHFELMYKNKLLVLQERKKNVDQSLIEKNIQNAQIKFDAETKKRVFSPYLDKFYSQEEIKSAVR